MARKSSYLPEEEETAQPPWAAILRARGLAPEAPPTPLVGNASPAEVPGQSAQAYADAAQAEKAEGNEDAAARLTVRATEARAQENAAQGTPEPATPLAPVAQAPASAAPKMTMAPSAERGVEPMPWSWAVSRGNGQQAPQATTTTAQSPYGEFGSPPQYERANPGVSFFALALDAMLNKGRNAGRLVGQLAEGDDGYTNYQRRMKAAKDAADIDATKRRGAFDPFDREYKERSLAVREAGLGAREKQLEQSATAEQRRAEAQRIKFDPEHPMAEQVRRSLYAEGVRPGSLDGLGMEAMKAGLNEAQRNRVELAMSGELNAAAADKAAGVARATMAPKVETARQISNATQANKLELVAAGQEGKIAAEERADTREQSRRGEAFMQWYSKEAEKDLAIAKLMDGIDASPGGVAPGMAERFKTWLTDRGISEDRVKPYMQKQMILELWARQQSGAAISDTEEVRFAKQAASDPLASEEQINAAYEVMGDVISTWLRTKAAARPQEAMTVGEAAGINTQRWLGGMPVAPTAAPSQQAPATRRPRPAPRRSAPAKTVSADDLEF